MKILTKEIIPEIMDKVDKLEKNARNFERCLKVKICPNCGNSLNCNIEVWNDGGKDTTFECVSCNFVYKVKS